MEAHTMNDIIKLNNAIKRQAQHKARRRITSQSYNSREAYDTRRAKAYITTLWHTKHEAIVNGVKATHDKPTPQWKYDQTYEEYEPPKTTPRVTRNKVVLAIDDDGNADIYTGKHTQYDTHSTLEFTKNGTHYTLYLCRTFDLPQEIRTPYGTYTADDIRKMTISQPGYTYVITGYTTK